MINGNYFFPSYCLMKESYPEEMVASLVNLPEWSGNSTLILKKISRRSRRSADSGGYRGAGQRLRNTVAESGAGILSQNNPGD
jgi:hypothetical protein